MRTDLSEHETRARLIDEQLARSGWVDESVVLIEELAIKTPADDASISQFADYALVNDDGEPFAIIEAKRTSRDEIAGKRQASDYADLIKSRYGIEPFIFLSSGLKTWFWDRELYAPREMM